MLLVNNGPMSTDKTDQSAFVSKLNVLPKSLWLEYYDACIKYSIYTFEFLCIQPVL